MLLPLRLGFKDLREAIRYIDAIAGIRLAISVAKMLNNMR